jgi:hypothetical protein
VQEKKKGQDFILGCFYILNLEEGRKSVSLSVSSGLQARGCSWVDSCVQLC